MVRIFRIGGVMSLSKGAYRWDIQGLRAIAVLSVVIFHISPSSLPGGYIGVDIFFVISGYLIIGHIYNDLNRGRFDLIGFYSKRIKRLFPPLFVLVTITSIIAYIYLFPSEIKLYSGSVISTVLYFSNIYFYNKSDYFSSDLENSLLLHTWSLSVEEQFYLLFPIIMMLIFRLQRKNFVACIVSLMIISLVLSELLVQYNPSSAFYMSPSRFWQFIIGGVIAISERNKNVGFSPKAMNMLGGAGFAAILLSLYFYSYEVVFPGINALLPTIAVALIIFSGRNRAGVVYRMLSMRLGTFIGKISYSVYLWHWPIIIFYKFEFTALLGRYDNLLLLILSILAGYIGWYLVEKRVTLLGKLSAKKVISYSCIMSAACCCVAIYFSSGLAYRFNDEQLKYAQYLDYDSSTFREGKCFLSSKFDDVKYFDHDECITFQQGKKNILLMGDSHAGHFYTAIHSLKDKNATISQVTSSGCKPTVFYIGAERCTSINKWSYGELVREKSFDQIILSARWSEKDIDGLLETITYLEEFVPNVVVMGPSMEYGVALPRLLTYSDAKYKASEASENSRISKIDMALELALSETSAKYISIFNLTCGDAGKCISVTQGNIPVSFDYGHFTHEGAVEILSKSYDW